MSFMFEEKKKTEHERNVKNVVIKLIENEAHIGSWTGTPDSLSNTIAVYENLVELGLAPKGLSDYDASEVVDKLVDEVMDFIESNGKIVKGLYIDVLFGGRGDKAELYELPDMGYALVCEGYESDSGVGFISINFYKAKSKALEAYNKSVKDMKEEYSGLPKHRLVVSKHLA